MSESTNNNSVRVNDDLACLSLSNQLAGRYGNDDPRKLAPKTIAGDPECELPEIQNGKWKHATMLLQYNNIEKS